MTNTKIDPRDKLEVIDDVDYGIFKIRYYKKREEKEGEK